MNVKTKTVRPQEANQIGLLVIKSEQIGHGDGQREIGQGR